MPTDPIPRLNAALESRYRIERELGEGGMATVYLAQDLKHERKVALKVLKPELAAVVGAERFLAEIKTTANLQHPHILPLFDSGEADSFLFYVMPYVEGESLRERLDREHQLPVDEAVQIAKNVAEALDYAHRQGVIHRDIKPANVLLLDGKPVISDFGIALAVGAAGGGRLTETGLSLGTPHYMSPEQATGDANVGPAADVYALGCVLYEMLVGDPPHVASTPQAILGKIITEPPPQVTKARKTVPANVEAAIGKALEKVPADRFGSAVSFAAALGDASFRHGPLSPISRTGTEARWRRIAVAMTSVAALFALAFGWALQHDPMQPVGRYSIELPVAGPQGDAGSNIAISPDGTQIVYRGDRGDGGRLWHRPIDQIEATPIPGTEGAIDPVFSPDGTRVAFERLNGVIGVTSPDGGTTRLILDDEQRSWWGLTWGPDGYTYGFTSEGLGRVPETGWDMELVTSVDVEGGERAHGWPQVLPRGGGLLFTVVRAARAPGRIDPNEYQIAVVDLETGLREVLVPGVFARYAMSGHLVYVTEDGALMAAPFDPDALRLGDPRVLAEGISIGGSESVNLALSAGGTLIYQTGSPSAGRGEFIWVTRSGDAVPVHQGWTVSYYSSANAGWSLSPDDTRAVFSHVLQGNQDVWLKVLPDGPESRLTFSEATDRMPRWAPDGQTITFRSDRTEPLVGHLWSKRADGAGEAEVLFDQEAIAFAFWGPTGEWLILRRAGAAGVEGARDVLALRPGIDSTAIPLIADDRLMEQGPAISPDGRWIAYSSNETGRDEIFVRPFPGVESGRWQVSTEGGIKPVWSHSGREIFFVDAGNSMTAAAVETDPTFVVVERQKLFVLPPGTVVAPNADFYDVTSDDQRFLMVREIPDDPAGSPHRTVLVHNFFEELKRLVPN